MTRWLRWRESCPASPIHLIHIKEIEILSWQRLMRITQSSYATKVRDCVQVAQTAGPGIWHISVWARWRAWCKGRTACRGHPGPGYGQCQAESKGHHHRHLEQALRRFLRAAQIKYVWLDSDLTSCRWNASCGQVNFKWTSGKCQVNVKWRSNLNLSLTLLDVKLFNTKIVIG